MKNMLWITCQRSLFHKYPFPPQEVEYLGNLHRHLFHFKVGIEIFHNERDVEFIMFKQFVEEKAVSAIPLKSTWSCESMADVVYEIIANYYPNRAIFVEVSEDGENGIIKYYNY